MSAHSRRNPGTHIQDTPTERALPLSSLDDLHGYKLVPFDNVEANFSHVRLSPQFMDLRKKLFQFTENKVNAEHGLY